MISLKGNLRKRIQEKLEAFVSDGAAPGAQLALGWKDESLGIFCAGVSDPVRKIPVSQKTWFDLASLTKILATTDLLMTLLQRGQVNLDVPLGSFLPSLNSELRFQSLRNILNHRAGLPAIFEKLEELPTRDARVESLLQQVDESYKPQEERVVYSDVGFMLLGLLIERNYGKRLREVFGDRYEMKFGPIPKLNYFVRVFDRWGGWRKVATCQDLGQPSKTLEGEIQDPRASWLFGDAGHAGLFGTAAGVELWGQELYMAYHGKSILLKDHVVRQFIDFENAPKDTSFLNGFDRPSLVGSQAGKLLDPRATIGHMGYTGTSFWMNIERGFRISLLCHRFSKGIDAERIKVLRPTFHDWLVSEVFSKLSG